LGCLALQQGQLKEAQEHFTRALSLNPLADDALTGWGRTLLAADDQEAAWEKITLALRYNRDNQEALQLLAQAASHRRQLIEAANLLNNYMTKHGLNLQVLLSLAEVLARLEVFSEAQEALNKVLLFEPDNVKALALQEAIAAALSRWQ
jgi:tetratricopeptide (TPR) repeat protein